jgi:hypothetical protein
MLTTARFFGGPCDNSYRRIDLHGNPPPGVLSCKGSAYYFIEGTSGDLIYGSPGYIEQYNAKATVAGQRDVFAAWHRLLHTLGHRATGERARVERARQRIKRALR